MSFFKGNVYCIIGDNGAGKTSLLYMLIGLMMPTSGFIKFNGIDMEISTRQFSQVQKRSLFRTRVSPDKKFSEKQHV